MNTQLEQRLSAIEKRLDRFQLQEKKVALLVSESTYHAIIDQVIELESGELERDTEDVNEGYF